MWHMTYYCNILLSGLKYFCTSPTRSQINPNSLATKFTLIGKDKILKMIYRALYYLSFNKQFQIMTVSELINYQNISICFIFHVMSKINFRHLSLQLSEICTQYQKKHSLAFSAAKAIKNNLERCFNNSEGLHKTFYLSLLTEMGSYSIVCCCLSLPLRHPFSLPSSSLPFQ